MILLSGSYMLYGKHHPRRPAEEVFRRLRLEVPNVSGRMDNLRAAILRPQIALADRAPAGRRCIATLEAGLARHSRSAAGRASRGARPISARPSSSCCPTGRGADPRLSGRLRWRRGVELKWFGADDPVAFTSRYDALALCRGAKLPRDRPHPGRADRHAPAADLLAGRCALIARILRDEALRIGQAEAVAAVETPLIQ
jgi:hypothetical protein